MADEKSNIAKCCPDYAEVDVMTLLDKIQQHIKCATNVLSDAINIPRESFVKVANNCDLESMAHNTRCEWVCQCQQAIDFLLYKETERFNAESAIKKQSICNSEKKS